MAPCTDSSICRASTHSAGVGRGKLGNGDVDANFWKAAALRCWSVLGDWAIDLAGLGSTLDRGDPSRLTGVAVGESCWILRDLRAGVRSVSSSLTSCLTFGDRLLALAGGEEDIFDVASFAAVRFVMAVAGS